MLPELLRKDIQGHEVGTNGKPVCDLLLQINITVNISGTVGELS